MGKHCNTSYHACHFLFEMDDIAYLLSDRFLILWLTYKCQLLNNPLYDNMKSWKSVKAWKVNVVIYFDNSATTKPYEEVIQSYVKVASDYFGNPSSLHHMGGISEKLLTEARSQIASLLSIKENEIIFTSGGTEGNNLAIKGAAWQYRNRGKHLITTTVEHASVHKTFEQLKEMYGFDITYIPVDASGRVDVQRLEEEIREDTILVSVMHVNNEVGTVQPIEEIGKLLQMHPKIVFHVDDVQGLGKVPLQLTDSRIDLCSYSAHKFHGLKGNGFLYKKESCELVPLLTGGEQERKYRSGTENVAGIVAMAKALRLTLEEAKNQLENIREIKDFLQGELEKIALITIHTPKQHAAPHILNFSIQGIKSEVFIHALGERDVYVSTTSACSSKKNAASPTLLAMGIEEELSSRAIRISLAFGNTIQEAKKVVEIIKETVKKLGKVMK